MNGSTDSIVTHYINEEYNDSPMKEKNVYK